MILGFAWSLCGVAGGAPPPRAPGAVIAPPAWVGVPVPAWGGWVRVDRCRGLVCPRLHRRTLPPLSRGAVASVLAGRVPPSLLLKMGARVSRAYNKVSRSWRPSPALGNRRPG